MMGLSSFNTVATPLFHRAIFSSFAVAVAVGVTPYMEFREHVRTARRATRGAARRGNWP